MKKYLFCLRGCPASGKSTYLSQHRASLKPYTLSSDEIRRLFPWQRDINGYKQTTTFYENETWKLLMMFLEKRMQIDDYVILDATHYKLSSISQYKTLANKYNFEIVIVDFYSNIDLDTLKQRNKAREIYKRVPDEVIERMFEIINSTEKSQYKIISPDEMTKIIETKRDWVDVGKLFDDIFIDKNYNKVFEVFPIFKNTVDFDQHNDWHTKTLWYHTIDVIEGLPFNLKDSMVYWAALFHDIGKLYTQCKGKNPEDTNLHYYGHPIKSLEITKNQFLPVLKNKYDYADCDLERLYRYIEFHDLRFKGKVPIQKYFEKGFENKEEIKCLLYLQYADLSGHARPEVNELKRQLEEQYLEYFGEKMIH